MGRNFHEDSPGKTGVSGKWQIKNRVSGENTTHEQANGERALPLPKNHLKD
jgi:hypothetical protein